MAQKFKSSEPGAGHVTRKMGPLNFTSQFVQVQYKLNFQDFKRDSNKKEYQVQLENVKNQVQIMRGYDYQVDVAIWAHKHSYDRMWPVCNYTVFNKKPMPYVNSKASFYEFFIDKFVF